MSKLLSFLTKPLGLALFLFVLASCGSSKRTVGIEEGWDLLGEHKVDFVKEKDEININPGTRYTALRFKVEDRDIKLSDLRVVFTNGDKLEPNVDVTIPAGKQSRDIELSTEGRDISKITFTYRTTGSVLKGRARLLVFGKRYDPGYGY